MFSWSTKPVFCFTSDIDWASETTIAFSHRVVSGDQLKLTYFNTHPSHYLTQLEKENRIRLLIHPNFLPDSSHGKTFSEVMEYCLQLAPTADGFRCHRYFEVNDIMDEYVKRGFKFVSNHCTRCEPHIQPLWHRSGLLSLPIFFEDGGYLLMDPTLNFDQLRQRLGTPGLKIINFHPAHMAFNTPDFQYTRKIKDSISREAWNNLSAQDLQTIAYQGHGIRTIVQKIIAYAIENRCAVFSLHEIYEEYKNKTGSTVHV